MSLLDAVAGHWEQTVQKNRKKSNKMGSSYEKQIALKNSNSRKILDGNKNPGKVVGFVDGRDITKPNPSLPLPILDRVLISRKKPETITAGGIIVPEMALEDDQHSGYVLAVGPLVGKVYNGRAVSFEIDPGQVIKVGDVVGFANYAGKEIKHNGKEYLIMKESEIDCILP